MAAIPPSQQGLSLAGKALFGSLCAGTFGLGVWQTQRYFEKHKLVAQREADLRAPPVTAPHLVQNNRNSNDSNDGNKGIKQQQEEGVDSSFRRLRLQGQYLHGAEFLVGPRGPPAGALPDRPGTSAAGLSSAPQGYYVLTPFVPSSPQVRQAVGPVVIVNRGWVPRQLVVAAHAPDRRRPAPPPRGGDDEDNRREPPRLLEWDRPVPAAAAAATSGQQSKSQQQQQQSFLDVTVVPTRPERPRFLVAEHNMKERPPKLFWYDLDTMQEWIGWKNHHHHQSNSGNTSNAATAPPVRLYTAVAAEEEDEEKGSSATTTSTTTTWPAAPPAQSVGKFKVEPAVHAGYALTWYGLSAAGVYMTRMMLTRGR